jgi:hypothetical protein
MRYLDGTKYEVVWCFEIQIYLIVWIELKTEDVPESVQK